MQRNLYSQTLVDDGSAVRFERHPDCPPLGVRRRSNCSFMGRTLKFLTPFFKGFLVEFFQEGMKTEMFFWAWINMYSQLWWTGAKLFIFWTFKFLSATWGEKWPFLFLLGTIKKISHPLSSKDFTMNSLMRVCHVLCSFWATDGMYPLIWWPKLPVFFGTINAMFATRGEKIERVFLSKRGFPFLTPPLLQSVSIVNLLKRVRRNDCSFWAN